MVGKFVQVDVQWAFCYEISMNYSIIPFIFILLNDMLDLLNDIDLIMDTSKVP